MLGAPHPQGIFMLIASSFTLYQFPLPMGIFFYAFSPRSAAYSRHSRLLEGEKVTVAHVGEEAALAA